MIELPLLNELPRTETLAAQPRPYINHAVRFLSPFTREERSRVLAESGLNVFWFPAEMVTGCDMLSDSGTTTMTHEQWALLFEGDEAYGANRGYFMLRDQVRATFGEDFWSDDAQVAPNSFLYHQGRTAEHALFSALGRLRPGSTIVSNGHFDTTRANVILEGLKPIDLFSPELLAKDAEAPFKGNIDIARLEQTLEEQGDKVAMVLLTITNNTGGGQPVSMANIQAASKLARARDIPLFFDACRFAENAWFIQQREEGWADKSVSEIVHEMFRCADGFTISFKKDGLANMGGGLFVRRDSSFYERHRDMMSRLVDEQMRMEGHASYGGMSGRDLMALVGGLRRITDPRYLYHRIKQVENLGLGMVAAGLPIVTPVGGHAVYLEIEQFFADTKLETKDFGGVALSVLLLAAYGHRAGEVGAFNFGTFDPATGEETFPDFNYLRFAIPRLRYEAQDLAAVVEALRALHAVRDAIPGVEVTHGKDLPLRYFKARLRFRS